METYRVIHWVTPTKILGALFLAVALAVGHHCFYAHLSGQLVPSTDYHIAGSTLSRQQANVAIGTAFALLFKSALASAVATSFIQLFWRMLKTSKKPTLVSDADAVFSLLSNILELFKISVWRLRCILMTSVAVTFW